ncbi:hypothetical protein NQ315_006898 [Exocentrus adspersus]|uniref:Uncharacterized protein n=1 Tax=Exocentrus adspersus TaxID=1586481 RepID=A0AAV8WEJ8_9CUCU|nr:hypothetical protein NQ315_006898 [Exocentrus adspersus]
MDGYSLANKLKLDFNLNADISEVVFVKGSIKKYNEVTANSVFGEKGCLLYVVDILIYNVHFALKILTFAYENSSEILKLEIEVPDKNLEKEIAACRNFQQRHRNLNGTFLMLIQFAKLVETRRLIFHIVVSKEPKASLSAHEDGGFMIKYMDNSSNVMIHINWRIAWSMKDSLIVDMIEVYYNNFMAPNGNDIKENLTRLTHPCLDFHTKLKLWKLLMFDLRKYACSTIQAVITIRETQTVSEADSVLVISDNEEAGSSNLPDVVRSKRRRIEARPCPSSVVYVVPD